MKQVEKKDSKRGRFANFHLGAKATAIEVAIEWANNTSHCGIRYTWTA